MGNFKSKTLNDRNLQLLGCTDLKSADMYLSQEMENTEHKS